MERFTVQPERVGSEPVDDETLVIDFTTSGYYCLNSTAAFVWEVVGVAPHSIDEIATVVATRYDRSIDDVREDVATLVDALVGESLLGRADGTPSPPPVDVADRGPYVVPRFEKFGALEQLMLAGE